MSSDTTKIIIFSILGLIIGFLAGFYVNNLNKPKTFEECAVKEGISEANTKVAANIIADMCWDRFNTNKK